MGLSNFFGGGGTTTKSYSYLPVQATWLKNMLGQYGPQVGEGQPSYPGQRVAPLTGTQQGALKNVGGWEQYLNPANQMPMFNQTGSALGGILSGQTGAEAYTPEAINTLFEAAYKQPAMRAWNEQMKPEIQEAYSGPGYWHSDRMAQQTKGAQDVQNWLGEQYGNMRFAAEESNRAIEEAKAGRALSAIPMGMEYGQMPTQQALAAIQGRGALYGLGSAEQEQAQQEINAQMEQFIESERLTDPESLAVILSLLGLNYSSSKGVTREQGMGFQMGQSGVNAAGGAILGMLSDVRAKENIHPVRDAMRRVRDLAAYHYNYRGSDRQCIGLLAQEVERVLPEAVVERDGLKTVKLYEIQSLIVSAINELA